jgi:hypothetical protein
MTQDQINKICALFCGLEYQEGWWCEKCQSFVDGRQVTYQENHETCGYPVIYKMVDFSPSSPDWWTLWDKVTTWEHYDRFRKFVQDRLKRENINDMSWFEIYLVNNLPSNLVAYLRYAFDNGLHPELFKVECPCPPEYQGDKETVRVCPYCGGSGTIDTPLAKAVKEGK